MNEKENRRKLLEYRRKKAELRASFAKATDQELEAMLIDPTVSDALDIDDDDVTLIFAELDRRGIHLWEGEEVPIEELLKSPCPDCEELRRQMEEKAGKTMH